MSARIIGRFFCRVCNCGQGISEGASPAQREAFDRFVAAHQGCK